MSTVSGLKDITKYWALFASYFRISLAYTLNLESRAASNSSKIYTGAGSHFYKAKIIARATTVFYPYDKLFILCI